MTFLGRTAEQLFTQFKAARPFGDGPWPCLNPAADHFRQSVVIECRVVGKSDGNEGQRPHGTFTCGCGFVYTRLGPDITEEDRFRKQYVLAFGPVWDAKLRELWSSSATISEIATQFKTDESNIRHLAKRRGLPSSRSNHHTVPTVVSQSGQIYVEVRGSKWSLETRRQRWLDHLDAHPGASRSELTKSGEHILKWLKINDGEWLEAHLPPNRTPPPRPRRVDYEARDINLAEKIRRAALRISQRHGRPVRVTITAIVAEIKWEGWINERHEKLPRTAQAIAESVESLEEFTLRKVQWTEQYYAEAVIVTT